MKIVIEGNRIWVWIVHTEAIPDGLWPRIDALLEAGERKRANQFVFERDRRLYLTAHALKRALLTAAVEGAVPPEAWTFKVDARGKPRISQGGGLEFNLSHCPGLVACAVSQAIPLGIDVERLDPNVSLDLARTCFASAEQAWLHNLSETVKPAGFYALWTLKEAYIKATGLGLSQPLEAFAFHFDPLHVTFGDPALGDPKSWRFEQCRVGTDHVMALAWRTLGAEAAVEVMTLQPDLLINRLAPATRANA